MASHVPISLARSAGAIARPQCEGGVRPWYTRQVGGDSVFATVTVPLADRNKTFQMGDLGSLVLPEVHAGQTTERSAYHFH